MNQGQRWPVRAASVWLVAGLITTLPAIAEAWDLGITQTQEIDGEPRPRLKIDLHLYGAAEGTAEQLDPVAVDTADTTFQTGPLLWSQLKLGGELKMVFFQGLPIIVTAGAEGYGYSGQLLGEPNLDGVELPASAESAIFMRKAYGTVSVGPFLTLGGGLMGFQWGLGLLANSGDVGWEPGSARFSNPYLGDTNLRLMAATGPWLENLGLTAFVFRDQAYEDASLRPGDDAEQLGGGFRFANGDRYRGGMFLVQRRQETERGRYLEVKALDLTGGVTLAEGEGWTLKTEAEVALVSGETDLGPTFDHQLHDVRQFGGVWRTSLSTRKVGGVLDVVYATGDRNLADGDQNAFKADRNFEVGLLLYRHLLAAQTGYAATTASDPTLIGVPPEDIDRFPSGGGVTNTIAFFPRAWWRPLPQLELYGGPLFAFSEVPLVDPLNTNFGGGDARNALNGTPGSLLGTELDVGVRGQISVQALTLSAGLEGGLLLPGGAFDDAQGEAMAPLFGSRAMLRAQF